MKEKIKTLQINLTESEHKKLLEVKGNMTWREFLLSVVAKKR